MVFLRALPTRTDIASNATGSVPTASASSGQSSTATKKPARRSQPHVYSCPDHRRTRADTVGEHARPQKSATHRDRGELSDEQARRRLVSSATTPTGLIKHAAAGERIWFQHYLAGLPEAETDGYATRGAGSFAVSDDETLSDVIAEFERASARSRTIAEQINHPIPR